MAKKVSMQTIADELGLARSAVSRALSGKKGVGEATRRRVMAAARRYGYVPNAAPVPMPTQIVLLVEDRTLRERNFWGHVTNGLVSEVPLYNGFLSITQTDAENPIFTLPPLLEQAGKVDGVVAMHATDIRVVRAIKRLGIPVVLVDYSYNCPGYDTVSIDDHGGVLLMATELIKMGHRRFGFSGGLNVVSFRMRYEGLISALVQAGISNTLPPHWDEPAEIPFEDLPTAIFCCNDDNAARTIDCLLARGLRVPEDVSVVGFDDNPNQVATTCHVPLTTLRVDREELGRWAVRTLYQRLNNPESPPIQVTVGVVPVRRRSCGKPGEKRQCR